MYMYKDNTSIENKKCLICKVKLNEKYKFDTEKNRLKNKNNAYMIAKGNICQACNHLEILARMGTELVKVDYTGWDCVRHTDWYKISQARQKETMKFFKDISNSLSVNVFSVTKKAISFKEALEQNRRV